MPPRGNPSERRQASRRRQVMVEGALSWDSMLYPRRVCLKDLSALGARVELYDQDSAYSKVPSRVRLHIFSDRQHVECDVVWRRGLQLGLRFAGPRQEDSRMV